MAMTGMAEKSGGSRAMIAANSRASDKVARTAVARRQKSTLCHNLATTARLTPSWIERVAQPVAEQVERQHQAEDRQARPHRHPWRLTEEVARYVEHAAPARRRRLLAESEIRKRGLGEDCRGNRKCRLDQDRREHVGQNMAYHDAVMRIADCTRGLDVILVLDRERLPAGEAGKN